MLAFNCVFKSSFLTKSLMSSFWLEGGNGKCIALACGGTQGIYVEKARRQHDFAFSGVSNIIIACFYLL